MSSFLLKILRIIHLVRRYIGRTSSRWALFVAILRRKLSEWWDRSQWPGKPGPSKPAESSFPSDGARLCSSTPSGPGFLREYGVAASNVPASASQGNLSLRIHVSAEEQSATAPPSPIPGHATLPVELERSYSPNPSFLSATNFATRSRSSSNVSFASTQSRASERRSRITASRESLHTPVGQSAEHVRSPSYQFGRGPDPSRSRGRLSTGRSPSPVHPLHPTQQPHHLYVIPSHSHPGEGLSLSPTSDGRQSPMDMPSSSSNTQEPQRTSLTRGKTTSLDVHVQSPSLESLVIASPTHLQPLTEEPEPISTTQLPIVSPLADHSETASQRPSFAASAFSLPEGRFLQLINSEQVPRYTKSIRMQVDPIFTFIQSLNVLNRLPEEMSYTVEPLTTTFP
jgi:hypothetical protein